MRRKRADRPLFTCNPPLLYHFRSVPPLFLPSSLCVHVAPVVCTVPPTQPSPVSQTPGVTPLSGQVQAGTLERCPKFLESQSVSVADKTGFLSLFLLLSVCHIRGLLIVFPFSSL